MTRLNQDLSALRQSNDQYAAHFSASDDTCSPLNHACVCCRREKILSSLKLMQTSFEQKDADTRKSLIAEREAVRRECTDLRKELEEERRVARELTTVHRSQVDEVGHQLNSCSVCGSVCSHLLTVACDAM